MIRVLQVVTQMTAGGAESLIMNLYRNINRELVQFDFLVQTPQKGFYDDEIYTLGGRIFAVPYFMLLNDREYENAIVELLRTHPEISILHSHNNSLSAFVMRAAEKAGVQIRIAHAHIAKPPLNSWKNLVWIILRPYSIRLFQRYTTHRFACSKLAGDWQYGKSITYRFFPNAINWGKFKFDEQVRTRLRKELGLYNQTVYGNVGRLVAQKNHSKLVDIFYEAYKKDNDSCLLIVGEGRLLDKIKNKCKRYGILEKVIFTGNVKNVNDYYQVMDVFVFPTLFEGLPVTLIEAQANGLPCLVSDTVTPEVAISDLIKVMPLDAQASKWAAEAMNLSRKEQNKEEKHVKAGCFAIGEASIELTNFYQKAYVNITE